MIAHQFTFKLWEGDDGIDVMVTPSSITIEPTK